MTERPIDRRKLTIALIALLVVVAAVFGLSLTSTDEPREKGGQISEEKEAAIEDLCASRQTFDGLKKVVFDNAARMRTSEDPNFGILAANAFVRMENPAVESRNEDIDLTRCTGRFILELPPGAERSFDGERRLTADIFYEVQSAADGSGLVYRLSGAETIVSRLAAFDIGSQRLEPAEPVLPDDFLGELGAEPQEPSTAPEPAGPSSQPAPVPTPRTREDSNPSFDCDDARTRSELMVCGSGRLGTLDRRMADMYEDAMDDADGETRRRLVRTRDNFLAYRNRCRDEACVAQAYDGRMREIRDIMAAMD